MPTKCKKQLINLLFISSILLGGCSVMHPPLKTKDFSTSKYSISRKLPSLEPIIEYKSFANAYSKTVIGPESITELQKSLNDANLIFSNEVKNNINDNSIDNNGFISCKIINAKSKMKGIYYYLLPLDILTLFTPYLIGFPIEGDKFEVQIETEVRNIKNEIIAKYQGHGTSSYCVGVYYGRKDIDRSRLGNITALKRALDEVKLKMSKNADSISICLNKGTTEIQQEREIANKQSLLKPEEFLNGNEKYNGKDYKSAIKSYNSVLEEYPYHKYALYNRGNAQINLKNYNDAIKDFTRLIELDPKNAEAFYYRGVANENLKELYSAIYDFNKAIAYKPEMELAYFAKGLAEEDLKFNEEAAKDYKQVLKINPNSDLAKERMDIVQNEIQQQQQQQQAEQTRINNLNELSNSLTALSNSLNEISTVNNIDNSTTTSGNTSTDTGNNAFIEQAKTEANKFVGQAKKHDQKMYESFMKMANDEQAQADAFHRQYESTSNVTDKNEALNKYNACLARVKDYLESAANWK